MSIPSFYCPELNLHAVNDDSLVFLSENESAHAAKSRRLRIGNHVQLLNGSGLIALGEIEQMEKRKVGIKVGSVEAFDKPLMNLTIATAIPKGDRQKVMVDMLTQLGVDQMIPLDCEHSVTRFSSNMKEKWQRTAIEACKQSQNPWLPSIKSGQSVEKLSEKDKYALVYADSEGDNMSIICDEQLSDSINHLIVLIGPEGGFSKTELNFFAERNIVPVRLASNILRTEAAAVAAASQFNQVFNGQTFAKVVTKN